MKKLFWITLLAICGGFFLSAFSLAEICQEMCAKTHTWRLFGMRFEYTGMAFFGALGLMHVFSLRYSQLIPLVGLLFAGALGGEAAFILIQKYVIKGWCPLCLAIAACVAVGALAFFAPFIAATFSSIKLDNRRDIMQRLKKGSILSLVFLMSLATSYLGAYQIDEAKDKEITMKAQLAFGDISSPIEVYLFSDWACPSCRKLEPLIERVSPLIMKQAKLIFVDHVMHPETLNFIPYNLSFMLNNKDRYLLLRSMLTQIAARTGEPTEEEVMRGCEALGVHYIQLNYSDVAIASKYFKKLGEEFAVDGTPTMVIANIETKKGKKLVGSDEITEEKILQAINRLKSS